LVLLVGAKVTGIAVPFLFKEICDALDASKLVWDATGAAAAVAEGAGAAAAAAQAPAGAISMTKVALTTPIAALLGCEC
jgi:hypothetical protein